MTDKNILHFTGPSRITLSAEKVLSSALEHNLDVCIILGCDKDGDFYFASTHADGGEVLWWLKVAERELMKMAEV